MAGENHVVFRVDDAWDFIDSSPFRSEMVDVSDAAQGLRFITGSREIEAFADQYLAQFRPFTLSGSGDFHHLSAVWIRQFREPFTLISLDNHPDWDIRPPKWSCGAWINRALALSANGKPLVNELQIWGCGSFECLAPWRVLGNRGACKKGRLLVHPWRQQNRVYPGWLHPIQRDSWRREFQSAMQRLSGQRVYLTIDLDSLINDHAITNWEAGQMTREDVLWVIEQMQSNCVLIGGDICGGHSTPVYKTRFQRVAGWFDHPPITPVAKEELRRVNGWVIETLWPKLALGD